MSFLILSCFIDVYSDYLFCDLNRIILEIFILISFVFIFILFFISVLFYNIVSELWLLHLSMGEVVDPLQDLCSPYHVTSIEFGSEC